jgi:hypothetical protein
MGREPRGSSRRERARLRGKLFRVSFSSELSLPRVVQELSCIGGGVTLYGVPAPSMAISAFIVVWDGRGRVRSGHVKF